MDTNKARRAVKAAEYLLQDRNVLSVGLGIKNRNSKDTKRYAISITVRKKLPKKSIPSGYCIPKKIVVPKMKNEREFTIQTDVIEKDKKRFSSDLDGRSSISMKIKAAGAITTGTLGSVIEDRISKKLFLISCSHVLTDFGRVSDIGHPIIDPNTDEILGKTSRFVQMRPGTDLYADVAIAQIRSKRIIDEFRNGSLITGLFGKKPRVKTPVIMVKSDLSIKMAKILRLHVTEKVFGWSGYVHDYCTMMDQIEVTFGNRGESGSLVLSENYEVIGILIATGLVTPIETALNTIGYPNSNIARAPNDLQQMKMTFL